MKLLTKTSQRLRNCIIWWLPTPRRTLGIYRNFRLGEEGPLSSWGREVSSSPGSDGFLCFLQRQRVLGSEGLTARTPTLILLHDNEDCLHNNWEYPLKRENAYSNKASPFITSVLPVVSPHGGERGLGSALHTQTRWYFMHSGSKRSSRPC